MAMDSEAAKAALKEAFRQKRVAGQRIDEAMIALGEMLIDFVVDGKLPGYDPATDPSSPMSEQWWKARGFKDE